MSCCIWSTSRRQILTTIQYLYAKPRWLVLNKLDMVADPEEVTRRLCDELDWQGPVFGISALSGEGTQDLVWKLQDWLDEQKKREQEAEDIAAGLPIDGDPRFDPTRSTPPAD